MNDQSYCYKIDKSGFEGFNPTIFELDKNYVFVDHEKHALCDSYIVDFIHEATENYYERGKYGCRSFHGTETPLYVLKVLKLLLFYLPILVTMCFLIYFLSRFLCIGSVLYLNVFHICFLMLFFTSNPYFLCEHLLKLFVPNLKTLKKSTCWEINQEFP